MLKVELFAVGKKFVKDVLVLAKMSSHLFDLVGGHLVGEVF